MSTSSTMIISMLADANVDVSDTSRSRRRARNTDHSAKLEVLVAVVVGAEVVHVETMPTLILQKLPADAEPPT